MRYIKLFLVFFIVLSLSVSCKILKKDMSMEDYHKIDLEITTTDMKPESIEAVVEKYGYSVKQYNDMSEKIKNDPKLQEKLGDIRLGEQKKDM